MRTTTNKGMKYRRRGYPLFGSGQHLKAARTMAGLQQKELAKMCSCHEASIRYWEKRDEPFAGMVPGWIKEALAVKGVTVGVYPDTITREQ